MNKKLELTNKPPLGVTPQWLEKEIRLKCLSAAIMRYWSDKLNVPQEWYDEKLQIEYWLIQYFKYNKNNQNEIIRLHNGTFRQASNDK